MDIPPPTVTCSGGHAGTLLGPGAPGSGSSDCIPASPGDAAGLNGGSAGTGVGAGGGGYYGGGAGAATFSGIGTGGGGGSDYPFPISPPIGVSNVTVTDGVRSGNGLITITFTIDDDLALGNVPSDITTYATSPSGAVVTYTAPTVVDEDLSTVTEICNHASGSVFPIGQTTVDCFATDADGDLNSPDAEFSVTVDAPRRLSSESTNCNGVYWGTGANVVVPAHATCTLVASTRVTNTVTVNRGGTLYMNGVRLGGNLSTHGSATICGSTITHSVVASRGSLALGGPGCAGNTIIGYTFVTNDANDVSIWDNTLKSGLIVKKLTGATDSIVGNRVFGDLLVAHSGPPVEVSGNQAINLSCNDDTGLTGSGNTAHGTDTCNH
jgi:hypothetical protein